METFKEYSHIALEYIRETNIPTYLKYASIVVLLLVLTIIIMIYLPKKQCFFTKEEINLPELCIFEDEKIIEQLKDKKFIDDIMTVIPHKSYKIEEIGTRVMKGIVRHGDNKRCIIPFEKPKGKKTGVWCDGENKFFFNNKYIIYDDTKPNAYFNKHKIKKVKMLIIDL